MANINRRPSQILKVALFATGLAGIVAEYILATLATYFLGNSVVQWTMVLSIMLFSMGLGSRLTKFIETRILERFIVIEFILSLLVSFSAMFVYLASGFSEYTGILIYTLSIAIGLLIGMEIPMVIRLNDAFESLKVNIAAVMEKDYYGSLLGGIFFVFVGLPYLGLTYTPFALGAVNFIVAMALLWGLRGKLAKGWHSALWWTGIGLAVVLALGTYFAEPIIRYGEQGRYRDKVVYADQSKYQNIVVTQWKNDHWFYLNSHLQFSTRDEWLYHEPLVHPAMKLSPQPKEVLVLGGGDGCAVREALKYEGVERVTLVDLDEKVTRLARENPIFTKANEDALNDSRVRLLHGDAYAFMEETNELFDVMILDFPDPKSVELSRLYSAEFYRLCNKHLRPHGVLVTQAGSPYYATRAFMCIEKTLQAAGYATTPLHNHVPTMGEWGWVVGTKHIEQARMKKVVQQLQIDPIPTRWLNQEAMHGLTVFGKQYPAIDSTQVEVNRVHSPVLNAYYTQGNWDIY